MTRSPDILFIAEYIKNVLYFATVRQGKVLKDSSEAHYFSIDEQLVYENYYSDFGPLNLGCVYKYCTILDEKLKQYLKQQIAIVHYTSVDPKKKANAAFLLGCYGVIYLNLAPQDAIKPLLVHGQTYRPFQDATQGDSAYTISMIDCLQAVARAKNLGFFNFQDFSYEEYERLDKIQGGDLNWIVPGKFLAFIGPVDYSVSLYHPPEMYIEYFKANDVKIVIRLNKRLYDSTVFSKADITHYDLFFPDGSCPGRHILMKFLQISEESQGAIAVHCKAGLGRTGSLIGCYLIKHYRMTAREAIGWMRICRPGSVIGQQQGWLEHLEAWLLKQGNLYRKRTYHDIDRLPTHPFGVYSIAEKTQKQRQILFNKSPSPPPPIQRQILSNVSPPVRPQASKTREEKSVVEDEEVFLTSCDLTVNPQVPLTQMKGCVLQTASVEDETDELSRCRRIFLWKKYLCCQPCTDILRDNIWLLAVRCANFAPHTCSSNICCMFLDTTKKEQFEWHVTSPHITYDQKNKRKGTLSESSSTVSRRSGAGEPRITRSPVRGHSTRSQEQRSNATKPIKTKELSNKNYTGYFNVPTFATTHGPVIKTVNDAKNFLMKSSIYNEQRDRHLNSSIRVTPQYSTTISTFQNKKSAPEEMSMFTPSYYSSGSTQPQQRRRLGRSPSPPVSRMTTEQSRATNTAIHIPADGHLAKESKTTLREALSRLKVSSPRDGSVGAASLGARREAPAPMQAPSTRSDERPLATQGDMLNSIKFQRRFRESLRNDNNPTFKQGHEKKSIMSTITSREKTSVNSKTSSGVTRAHVPDFRCATLFQCGLVTTNPLLKVLDKASHKNRAWRLNVLSEVIIYLIPDHFRFA